MDHRLLANPISWIFGVALALLLGIPQAAFTPPAVPPEAGIQPQTADQARAAVPDVTFANLDVQSVGLAHTTTTPGEALYAAQWGLAQIQAQAAWEVVAGTADVVIAEPGSGLDTNHPDLAGQLWVNPDEIADNGLDDDDNGYVDDIHGWNVVDGNTDLSDNTGHSTMVVGIIAAAKDGEGITGVCWGCRLMIVKVTQSTGLAYYSDIAEGVRYAAQNGADVISISLRGRLDQTTLRSAMAAAAQTAVVVSGAGNDGSHAPVYPAAYDDHVLAVAATSSDDVRIDESNYGAWVDVSAPGKDITITSDGGGYLSKSGTSLAVPFVSGLAGLLRSQHPDWSPDLVRAQIIHTADRIDALNSGFEGQLGSGRINAGRAVTTVAQPLLSYEAHKIEGRSDGRPESGSTVELEVTLYNDWADATNVQATLSTSDRHVTIAAGTTSYGDIMACGCATNMTPLRFSLSDSVPHAHPLSLTLEVTADEGYRLSIPLTIPASPGFSHLHGTRETAARDPGPVVAADLQAHSIG